MLGVGIDRFLWPCLWLNLVAGLLFFFYKSDFTTGFTMQPDLITIVAMALCWLVGARLAMYHGLWKMLLNTPFVCWMFGWMKTVLQQCCPFGVCTITEGGSSRWRMSIPMVHRLFPSQTLTLSPANIEGACRVC